MELNFKNLEFIDENIDFEYIKDNFNKELISDFNQRNFNVNNINSIIKLCLFLKIKEINNFLLKNLKPSTKFYMINFEYSKNINLPKDIVLFTSNTEVKYNLRKKNNEIDNIPFYKLFECIKLHLDNWIEFALNNNSENNLKLINCQLCNTCAKFNNLKSLKLIHKRMGNKIGWNTKTINIAVKKGNVDILNYLIDNGCTFNINTIKYIIEEKDYNGIKILLKKLNKDVILSIQTSKYVIEQKDVNLLKYFYEIGCNFNYDACQLIALHGNLECLKFLLQKKLFYEKDFAAKILYDNCQDDFMEKYFNPNLEKMCLTYIKNNNMACLKQICDNYKIKLNPSKINCMTNSSIIKYLTTKKIINKKDMQCFN